MKNKNMDELKGGNSGYECSQEEQGLGRKALSKEGRGVYQRLQ